MGKFDQRCYDKEIMDDLEVGGEILKQTLRELRTINRFLGGNHVTTSGLKILLSKDKTREYTIADIGCGGGDMLRVMADWTLKHGIKCKFLGVDANEHTIGMAKANLKNYSNISFLTQNIFDKEFEKIKVDVVTCTLFTHHFNDEELIFLLRVFKKSASLGMVINDLHRHPLAYYSIRLLTALFSRSPMVQNDGPLSVLRGFTRKDIKRVLQKSGMGAFQIQWNWAFRWRVICRFN
ncbi:methyltransferase domain-containing protein [Aquiflexum sp. TKW24L]|uniref:methyltransferase domain-containing protein n=1 Tax=Aquiflexum sp. TKW24L TaxID=2942212 RepID=UPI0020C13D0F|nr:methyltransferase domain-containing protein [Aquiflexum sp. TKW24L]MCL6258930.1 methyltransferase domain-containing protein [Aquiflexum sp. TKW24L]